MIVLAVSKLYENIGAHHHDTSYHQRHRNSRVCHPTSQQNCFHTWSERSFGKILRSLSELTECHAQRERPKSRKPIRKPLPVVPIFEYWPSTSTSLESREQAQLVETKPPPPPLRCFHTVMVSLEHSTRIAILQANTSTLFKQPHRHAPSIEKSRLPPVYDFNPEEDLVKFRAHWIHHRNPRAAIHVTMNRQIGREEHAFNENWLAYLIGAIDLFDDPITFTCNVICSLVDELLASGTRWSSPY
jgi:hypothetical protein